MNHTTLKQFGIGFVLALVGVTLFFVQKNDTTTSAQTNTTYSSTWKATKVLTVRAEKGLSTNLKNTGNAGIGVWEWQVNGTVGTKTYAETWSAPAITGINFQKPSGGLFTFNDRGCDMSGVNDEQLMAGCGYIHPVTYGYGGNSARNDALKYVFEIRNTRGYSGVNGSQLMPNKGTGRQSTTSCGAGDFNEDTYCMVQSGAYSFNYLGVFGNSNLQGHTYQLGFGTLMPLQWTVSGTISN